jgi:hypothetical protein
MFTKICNRNPAAWQKHSPALYTTEFKTEFWHGSALMNSLTSCMNTAVAVAFLLKPWVLQALLSFHHSKNHAAPSLSSS